MPARATLIPDSTRQNHCAEVLVELGLASRPWRREATKQSSNPYAPACFGERSARASLLGPRAQHPSSEHQVVLDQHPAAVLDLLHLRHGAGEMVGFRELGGRRTEDILEGIAGF